MSDEPVVIDYEAEARRVALATAQLDARIKEADLAMKTRPWLSLTNPTTLLALITGFATLQTGLLSFYQSQAQRDETAYVRKQSQVEKVELEKISEKRSERDLIVHIITNNTDKRASHSLYILWKGDMLPYYGKQLVNNCLVGTPPSGYKYGETYLGCNDFIGEYDDIH